jgi:hypothetical protein
MSGTEAALEIAGLVAVLAPGLVAVAVLRPVSG